MESFFVRGLVGLASGKTHNDAILGLVDFGAHIHRRETSTWPPLVVDVHTRFVVEAHMCVLVPISWICSLVDT